MFDLQKDPLNCIDIGEKKKISGETYSKVFGKWIKVKSISNQTRPIEVKVITIMKQSVKMPVKWCWEQTWDRYWTTAVHLRWVLYVLRLLNSTHHWANMAALSLVPWWSWHSLEIQIWWAMQSHKSYMDYCMGKVALCQWGGPWP